MWNKKRKAVELQCLLLSKSTISKSIFYQPKVVKIAVFDHPLSFDASHVQRTPTYLGTKLTLAESIFLHGIFAADIMDIFSFKFGW